jgi:hypothetical protein
MSTYDTISFYSEVASILKSVLAEVSCYCTSCNKNGHWFEIELANLDDIAPIWPSYLTSLLKLNPFLVTGSSHIGVVTGASIDRLLPSDLGDPNGAEGAVSSLKS